MSAPEGFKMPTVGEGTTHQGVLKAVTGNIGTQAARFFIHKLYDAKATEQEKREVLKPHEMVGFRNDPFTEYTCKIRDMSDKQKYSTQRLYERFKSQQETDETPLESWEAISEWEKVQLLQSGILTVDQITAFQDHELFKLGPGGKDLREKARWHINSKNPTQDSKQEMLMVIEENRKQAERMKQMEDELYKLQAQVASKGKKKTVETINEEAAA
jgi:hypothetical protein